MKLTKLFLLAVIVSFLTAPAFAGIEDRFSNIGLDPDDYIYGPELSSGPGAPTTGWRMYVVADVPYFISDGQSAISMIATGGATALDDVGDPDANSSIDLTDYYITWDSGDTDHDLFNYQGTGAFGDISVMRVEQVTGDATDGTVLEVVAADANVDPLVVSASGKANALVVGQNTGVVTIAGVAEGTNTLVLTAGDLTLTDGDLIVDAGDVRLDEDVEINGIITLANDMTIDNSANNVLEWNENSEEIKWTFASNVLDLSSSTGMAQLDVFDGSAATITTQSDSAADDFTVSLTGATDSSLILASSGTGTDALQINTSAGGMNLAVVGSAAGEDLTLDSDSSIVITASEAGVADSVVIQTDGAGSGIDIISLADIDISTTGAAGEDITLLNTGGSIILQGTEADGAAVRLYASDAAGGMDIDAGTGGIAIDITGAADFRVDSSAGSVVLVGGEAAADAVTIDAENAAGGIDVNAGTGGIAVDITGAADFRLDSSAGSVVLIGAEAAADAITIDAENAAGGMDIDYGTGGMQITGTGDAAFNVDADDGSLDFTDSSNISVTSSEAAEDLTISQIGANDSSIIITSAGTGTDALTLETSNAAGDIDVNAGDAITVDAGDIVVTTDDTAANQFKVDATGAIAGYAIVLETTDGGVQINADGGDNGDISIDSADDLSLVAAGDLSFTVTGAIDFNASELTDVHWDNEATTAANVLTTSECGKVLFIGGDPEYDTTLPAVSGTAGCEFTFILSAAPAGANYRVETGDSLANIIYGSVLVNGAHVAAVQEDSINFIDGTAAIGDWAKVISDGTNWYVDGSGVTAGAITVTTQD